MHKVIGMCSSLFSAIYILTTSRYNPTGPQVIHGTIPANPRPGVLTTSSGSYYTQSKPQYANVPASQFVSARTQGAKGNGIHDDTAPLQKALNATAAAGQILFVDAGTYLVTKTLYVPPGARIVGESYSVIMSSGAYFNDVKNPKPVVQIGASGEQGRVEWSDMIVSTQGGNTGQMGAILIEWNLAAPAASPSGMWEYVLSIPSLTTHSQSVVETHISSMLM